HSQADESNDEEDELDEEEQTKPETSDEVIPDAAPVEASSDEGSLVSDALSDTGDESFSISTLGWTGIGLGLIGIAAAAGGGDSTPPPDAPSIALDTDTGKAADDGITTVGTLNVTGLSVEAAATWEYSTDGGTNWIAGQGTSIVLTDAGSYTVVVRQTVGDKVSASSASVAVTLDLSAAALYELVSSSADQTIVLNYSEALDDLSTPAAAAFTVRQGGIELAVDGVTVSGSSVTLSVTGLASGSLQVAYAVPSEGASLQDIAGNSASGFSQIVVSDGYIRGAKVYLDANGDGVGDESELLDGVTSNSAGEILVEGDAAAGALIIVGGVNTDTGAVNALTLSAPVGYSVVNPLSTLVAQVIKSADPDAVAPTEAEAEALVATALGLTLADGESLSSYDPLSDSSEAALANRIVTAQIAIILVTAATASADAGAGEVAEAAALNNLATLISSATEDAPVTLDAATVTSILTDAEGTSLVSAEQLTAIQTSVETLETATSIEAVVTAQAEATDNVSAAAPSLALVPESDSGASASDGLTNVVAPSVQVSFDTTSLDGTAVIVGDRIEVLDAADGSVLATAIVTAADLASGAMTLTSLALNDGPISLVARVTDIAGNLSANAAVSVDLVIDTIPAVITSASAAQVDENSAAPQVVYTAVATDAGGGITFSLAVGANDGLSIDAGTGAVSLATSPDFETLKSYSFTVLATDGAGNVSEKAV
ncbi:Ig-like domain-containing protein, partial [Porticoccaceae bacterium]|nr:Ig-like domain-containing protein [Porticoccaceae bacterium]